VSFVNLRKKLLLILLYSEDIFPNAVDYYQGPEEDDDNDEDIELGSEEDSDGKFLLNTRHEHLN
jgi:hypothetical protein